MANTTLREYLDELNLLLDQEALEETIGHCRHILQHFPKNVETYRILGRALLDKQRHEEAGDVFLRVLSALPDDFTSHLGLSSVLEEKGQYSDAIWHLECAYEQDPNSKPLQDELKRLYERINGTAPDRIQMTRGALVRTYTKGRLYEQAASEARAAIKQAPERVDLLALLAQILWNNDRPVEASEIALQILEKLPDCIEANRILASLWLRNGRPAEAAPFIARLEQLDPFLAWQTAQLDGKPLPDDAFQLPHLDWDARAAAALATDVPDWVNTIGNVFEAPEEISLSDSAASWLSDAADAVSPSQPTAAKRPSSRLARMESPPEPAPFDNTPVELPDWAEEFMAGASTPDESEEDIPDWFKGPPSATAEPTNTSLPDIPDWLEESVNAPPSSSAPLPSGFTDLLEGETLLGGLQTDAASIQVDQVPGWLADEDETPPPADLPSPAVTPAAQPLDAMSWLMTGPLPPLEEPTQAPAESDFAWTPESADQSSVESTIEPSVAQSADMDLDWLNMTPATESPAAESAQVSDMDWFSNPPGSETPAIESTPAGDLDWLSDMPVSAPTTEPVQDWLADTPITTEPSETQPLPTAASDMDWLSDTPSSEPPITAAEPTEASDLDWLADMRRGEPPAPELTSASSGEQDWFSDLSSPEPATETQPLPTAESDMDWLSDMPSVESPASEPAPAFGGEQDWLSSLPSVESPVEVPPLPTAESDMDWLSEMPGEPLTTATEPAETGSLDWLADMPNVEPSAVVPESAVGGEQDWLTGLPSAEPATEVQSAENDMDWLRDMPGVPPAAEPASAMSGEQGWFSDLSSSEPAAESQSMPSAESDMDWFSDMPSTPPAVQPVEESGLDWLSDMPRSEQPAESVADQFAGTFELGGFDAATPEPAEMGDPMAWLQPYQGSTPSEDTAFAFSERSYQAEDGEAEQEEPLVSGETPEWLSTMAPTQQANERALEPTAGLEPLDWLTSASTKQTDEDWLSSLGSVPQPAVAPSPARESLPISTAEPITEEPPVEIEEEWLAAFEMPSETSGAVPSYAAPEAVEESPDVVAEWQTLFEPDISRPTMPTADETPDWLATERPATRDQVASQGRDWATEQLPPPPGANEGWFDSLAASQETARTDESLQQMGQPEPADSDDWLSSFRAEEPVADASSPAWMSEIEPLPGESRSSVQPVEDRFDSLLKQAAERGNQPPTVKETGVLNPEQVPDWLAGLGDEPIGEAGSSATISEGFTDSEPADWLRQDWEASATAGEQLAGMPVDALDFSDLDDLSKPAEPAAEIPDWLTSPAAESTLADDMDFSQVDFIGQGSAPLAASGAESGDTGLEDFDFAEMLSTRSENVESIQLSWLDEQPSQVTESTEDSAFDFDTVAQPTNLVNTSSNIIQEAGQAFSFERKPAWMRNKGASGGNVPPWMKKAADSSEEQSEDSAGWFID